MQSCDFCAIFVYIFISFYIVVSLDGPNKVHCLTRDFSPCLCHSTFQRQNGSFVSSAFSLHMAWIVIRFLSGNKVPSVFRGSLYAAPWQEALRCSVLPVPRNGKRERLTITQMQMFMKWPRIAYLFKADVENDRLVLLDGTVTSNI